jgi:hypothetical protein
MPIIVPKRVVKFTSAWTSTGSSGRHPYSSIQRTWPTIVVARTYRNSSLGMS